MKKTYIQPCTEVVRVAPMRIMSGSIDESKRGFSIDRVFDEENTSAYRNNVTHADVTFNVWQQTDDGFMEID